MDIVGAGFYKGVVNTTCRGAGVVVALGGVEPFAKA